MNQVTYKSDRKNLIELISYVSCNIAYPEHIHSSHYTIGYMQDGEILIKTGNETFTVTGGDSFVIEPNKNHEILPVSEFYTMTSVCIAQDYLLSSDPQDCLEKLMKLWGEKFESVREQLEDTLTVLYAQVTGIRFLPSLFTQEIMQHIIEEPQGSFSIEDMAQSVCVSPYHLIRQFKKEYGITPHKFQLQTRIRSAQMALRAGENLLDVASNTGFCDQSHFDRIFKRFVGMSPSEYLNSINKD